MILISWFKEIKSRDSSKNLNGIPGALRDWLLDLLSCSDPAFPTKDSLLPYAELSRTYSKMRSEAGQLLNAIKSSGMFNELLSTTKIELDSLSVDGAISFASKVPALCNDSSANAMDDIESSKQRLLTTSGYLKCVQVCFEQFCFTFLNWLMLLGFYIISVFKVIFNRFLTILFLVLGMIFQSNLHITVSSAVAAAVVWMSEFPTRLNPVILPLMASIKREQVLV